MATYDFFEEKDNFTIKAHPHDVDVPGAESWVVELCYEHTGGRRKPVTVALRPTCIEIAGSEARYNLFEYRNLVKKAAEQLMTEWTGQQLVHSGDETFWWLESWAME